MAFHQGYGAPQRQYNMLGDDSRYPQTVGAGTAAQNPFESQSSMQPGYPPTHQAMYDAPRNDSTWSVHDYGQSPFGDDATKETATLQRGSDNPYASDYRKPRSAGSWKKWTLIGLVVLLVVGGIAGGIAGWRVSANNKDNSASGTSSSGGSGKMQYSESLPRAQNSLGDAELRLSPLFFLPNLGQSMERQKQSSGTRKIRHSSKRMTGAPTVCRSHPCPILTQKIAVLIPFVSEGRAQPETHLLRSRVHAVQRPRALVRCQSQQRHGRHPAHVADDQYAVPLPKLAITAGLTLAILALSSFAHVWLGLQPDATGPSSYSGHEGSIRSR